MCWDGEAAEEPAGSLPGTSTTAVSSLLRGPGNSPEEVTEEASREGNTERLREVTPPAPGISLYLQDWGNSTSGSDPHPRPGPQEVLPALGLGA